MSERTRTLQGNSKPDSGGDMLQPGVLLSRGQYRIEKFLNSGGFGMTYLARNSLDRIVVIKECFPSFLCHRRNGSVEVRSVDHLGEYLALVNLFRAEARALARLEHPNIVGVHEVFDDNNTAYMALDFVEGKDLQDIVETDPERLGPMLVRDVLTKVLGAVSYIHEQGVLHRDISPDNILIDKYNTPVLIDFGSARDSGGKRKIATRLQSVKDGYSPHEFYAREMKHSASSDLYALGATFYFAITGEAPPPSQVRLAELIERKTDPYVPLKGRYDRFDPRVLETIDQSLAVVATRRVQSARNWLLAIDDQSRQVAALEKARNDERVEQLVKELVAETNAALEQLVAEKANRESKAEEQNDRLRRHKRNKSDSISRVEADETEKQPAPAETAMENAFETQLDYDAVEGSPNEILDTEAAQQPFRMEECESSGEVEAGVGSDGEDIASGTAMARSHDDANESTPTEDPERSHRQKRRRRRGFSIKWNLPPLYVSNKVQLAGELDR